MLGLLRISLVAAVLAWLSVAAFAAETVFPGNGWPKWQPYSATNPMPISGPTPSVAVFGSAASNGVVKASAGNLYDIYATCTVACWLMVFNSATVPADGATTAGIGTGNLVDCIPIAANGVGSVGNGMTPTPYAAGISVAISSTACATKTASTVGFIRARFQ